MSNISYWLMNPTQHFKSRHFKQQFIWFLFLIPCTWCNFWFFLQERIILENQLVPLKMMKSCTARNCVTRTILGVSESWTAHLRMGNLHLVREASFRQDQRKCVCVTVNLDYQSLYFNLKWLLDQLESLTSNLQPPSTFGTWVSGMDAPAPQGTLPI